MLLGTADVAATAAPAAIAATTLADAAVSLRPARLLIVQFLQWYYQV